jgi:hypothetical protein
METDVQRTIAYLLKRVEKLEDDLDIERERVEGLIRRVYELEHPKEKERKLARERKGDRGAEGTVKAWLALFVYLGLLVAVAGAQNPNPTSGSLYTYHGPTLGADWMPLGPQGNQPPFKAINDFPYGYGINSSGFCVLINPPANYRDCPVMGYPTDPSGPAWYPQNDWVGIVSWVRGMPAWFENVPGTFSGRDFVPTTLLTPTQLDKMRVGDVLDTNDMPFKCSGAIESWTTSRITTKGWYRQGGTEGATDTCTPTGTTVTLRRTKLYGANILTERNTGDQQLHSIGLEVDVVNRTGVDNTCWTYNQPGGCANIDGGIDIVNLGDAKASFGLQVRGGTPGLVSGISVPGPAAYGIISGGLAEGKMVEAYRAGLSEVGVSAVTGVGKEAFRNWDPGPVGGPARIKGRMYSNGDWSLGLEDNGGVGAPHTQRIFSSGHATSDATWFYSAGSGAEDGSVALYAALLATPVLVSTAMPTSCIGRLSGTLYNVSGTAHVCP